MKDLKAEIVARQRNEHLVSIIDGLRAAKEQHYSWLWDIHRALLCETSLHHNIEIDPTRCAFANWMRSVADEPIIQQTDSFKWLHKQHLKMHQAAAVLVLTASQKRPIETAVYDEFMNQRNRFKAIVERFERDLWGMACMVDQLTGVRNRHGMLSDLLNEQQRVVREDGHCTIAMIDIDHFKTINDENGHHVGDLVLQRLAELLTANLRPYDHLYRYGGEEFLVCLPGTQIEEAKTIMERIRNDIAVLNFTVEGKTIAVTASFGLSQIDRSRSVEECIQRADNALYVAKASGRNRIEAR